MVGVSIGCEVSAAAVAVAVAVAVATVVVMALTAVLVQTALDKRVPTHVCWNGLDEFP